MRNNNSLTSYGRQIYLLKRIRTIGIVFLSISIITVAILIILRLRNNVKNERQELLQVWEEGNYEAGILLTKQECFDKFTSMGGFIDDFGYNEFIAMINGAYWLEVYSYELSGGTISKLTNNRVSDLHHDVGAKTLGRCLYTWIEDKPGSGDTYYHLSINYDTAKNILIPQLGNPQDWESQGYDWVDDGSAILRDDYKKGRYLLMQPADAYGHVDGAEWPKR